MVESNLTKLEQELRLNREAIIDSDKAIKEQIARNGVGKGQVVFLNENGDRIRSKQNFDGDKQRLYVPIGTTRIVANCDLDITGLERTGNGVLQMHVNGKVTGKNVAVREAIIHATGTVNIATNPEKHTQNYITVVSGEGTQLNGVRYAVVNSGGPVKSDNGSLFSYVATEKDVNIGTLARNEARTGGVVYAGGSANVDKVLKGARVVQGGSQTMSDKITARRVQAVLTALH